jgi:hypothetical protein
MNRLIGHSLLVASLFVVAGVTQAGVTPTPFPVTPTPYPTSPPTPVGPNSRCGIPAEVFCPPPSPTPGGSWVTPTPSPTPSDAYLYPCCIPWARPCRNFTDCEVLAIAPIIDFDPITGDWIYGDLITDPVCSDGFEDLPTWRKVCDPQDPTPTPSTNRIACRYPIENFIICQVYWVFEERNCDGTTYMVGATRLDNCMNITEVDT